MKAADLGEIITLPNGKQVAIFGDSYGEPHVSGKDNPHYSSVAVPVTFDKNGKPHFGPPLNGTTLRPGYGDESPGPNPLFPMPNEAMWAGANNTLPAGSITTKDGKTYMMVVGTNTNEGLAPKGGSWLVEVTNDPANGWKPVPGSYQPWQSIENPNAAPGTAPLISDPTKPPTQISGYQGGDGRIYIAADGFDRQQGVTMYSVDPEHVGDRNAWQPWTGSGWGAPGPDSAQHAANISQGGQFRRDQSEGS